MTPAQLQTLKTETTVTRASVNFTYSAVTKTLLTWWNEGGDDPVAAYWNQLVVPDFWGYYTSRTEQQMTQEPSITGTTFDFRGTGMAGIPVGDQFVWSRLFQLGSINPSLFRIRQALIDVISSPTAPAPANRTHLTIVSRRPLLEVEKLFAIASTPPPTPTGALGSTTAVATMVHEGVITGEDIRLARAA